MSTRARSSVPQIHYLGNSDPRRLFAQTAGSSYQDIEWHAHLRGISITPST